MHADFDKQTLDAVMVQNFMKMVVDGQLSLVRMWDMLRAGKVLPDDFDA